MTLGSGMTVPSQGSGLIQKTLSLAGGPHEVPSDFPVGTGANRMGVGTC